MTKVYVKFGDFSKKDNFITCYEAMLDEHVVKIILPTTLYSTLQSMAKDIELPAFIVDGTVTGRGNHGEITMKDVKIKIPLTFNKEIENYICNVSIPTKRNRLSSISVPRWFQK